MIRVLLPMTIALFTLQAAAKAPACKESVKAFNEYEELDKENKVVTKSTIFDLPVWSPDGGFQGILVKKDQSPKAEVEVEVSRTGKNKSVKKKAWALKPWGENSEYFVASGLEPEEIFGKKNEFAGTYVVRLKLDGKVVCEESPRKVEKSAD